ncbi:hypothetical protein A4H97_10985 [Niastella yeongjuensis]|uniref:Uncharacterized protein n=1 Tax=Niastella yeongjuensis TaxID=354355 RepID=A0A1V9EFZ0_9BACT|nr:hypothetical protein A4H97_10985 [Niastella yeongjuensis]
MYVKSKKLSKVNKKALDKGCVFLTIEKLIGNPMKKLSCLLRSTELNDNKKATYKVAHHYFFHNSTPELCLFAPIGYTGYSYAC